MFVIVDTNRIISALLSGGTVFEVFLLNKSIKKLSFIAPEFMFFELGRNIGEIVKKSKLSSDDFSEVFEMIKEQIELIPFEEFNNFVDDARALSPHEKDIKYFALALYKNCGIWSDESFRNQSKVEIFSTGKLLSFLKN